VKPDILVDAVIAKKNLGTAPGDAELVIALGPGFMAKRDAHVLVETNRGHNLGRLIEEGEAEPNTGIPGAINNVTHQRVLRAPADGVFHNEKNIGDPVNSGDVVGYVDDLPVIAEIDGVVRGMIRPQTRVANTLKIGDIDPRGKAGCCYTISEKARAIGGSVLEAILHRYNR
jgi:xanthine dehydrogenase accessory factor